MLDNCGWIHRVVRAFSLLQFIVSHEVEGELKFTETLLKGTAFVLSRSEFPNILY